MRGKLAKWRLSVEEGHRKRMDFTTRKMLNVIAAMDEALANGKDLVIDWPGLRFTVEDGRSFIGIKPTRVRWSNSAPESDPCPHGIYQNDERNQKCSKCAAR